MSVWMWEEFAEYCATAPGTSPSVWEEAFTKRKPDKQHTKRTYMSGALKRKRKVEGLTDTAKDQASVHISMMLSDVHQLV